MECNLKDVKISVCGVELDNDNFMTEEECRIIFKDGIFLTVYDNLYINSIMLGKVYLKDIMWEVELKDENHISISFHNGRLVETCEILED